MTTVAAFLIAIGVLVAVHEWGHFAMARACGVKVLRFSIGLGPKMLGWTSSATGTEYVIGWLPFGGFVRMLDEREGEVAPQERALAFNTQPLRNRAAIVAAGPVANLLLAVLLYAAVNWTGSEQPRAIVAKPTLGSVAEKAGLRGGELVLAVAEEDGEEVPIASLEDLQWWLTKAALAHRNLAIRWVAGADHVDRGGMQVLLPLADLEADQIDASLMRAIGITAPMSKAQLGGLSAGGAAAAAGLQPGDLVLQVDGVAVVDAAHLRDIIRASYRGAGTVVQHWTVVRKGQTLELDVQPRAEKEGSLWVGKVGAYIGSPPATVWVKYGLIQGVTKAVRQVWDVSVLSLRMMGQMLVGQASLKNISGPITIADYAGKSAQLGGTQFAIFLALISVSLGVLNLLPVPVLDGGHLMYYLWEFVTGRGVTEQWMDRLQKAGMVLLLAMMSIAVFNDINRIVG